MSLPPKLLLPWQNGVTCGLGIKANFPSHLPSRLRSIPLLTRVPNMLATLFVLLFASLTSVLSYPVQTQRRDEFVTYCTLRITQAPAASVAPTSRVFFNGKVSVLRTAHWTDRTCEGVFARLQVSQPIVLDTYNSPTGWTWADNGDKTVTAGFGLRFSSFEHDESEISDIITSQWPGTTLFLQGSSYGNRNILVLSASC